MKKCFILFTALFCLCISHAAPVPPAQKLLPADTLFMVSIPDCNKLGEVFKASPQGQAWNDAAMDAFRKDFMKKFSADMLDPLEKELGFKFSEYKELAQGQFAFAMTQNGWEGKPDQKPGFILLLDAKDKSDQLKTNLARLKKQWTEGNKQLKTEKIRDVEFTTIVTSEEEIDKTFAKISPKKPEDTPATDKTNASKIEITVGQSGSLLLVGNVPALLEKVLINQTGGTVPSIADDATFDANYNSLFRDAIGFIWINPKPFLDVFKATTVDSAPASPLAPKPDKIFSALGLTGLKSIALSYSDTPEGGFVKVFLGAPESTRQGLFKMLVPEVKDSGAPPFIPADTVKFTRSRLDLQKAMAGFEKMMGDMSPAAVGVFRLIFDSAGKDQDPNFDFRKEVLGNLGDDLIVCHKVPRTSNVDDIQNPPTLYLISSPNAEKLAHALKIGFGSFAQDSFKEREFLGRKAYTMTMANPLSTTPSTGPTKPLNFAAANGYVAFSSDVAYLEEFLRSSEFNGKRLSETAGLTEAAQKVGGIGTGMLGFENQAEQTRSMIDALKKNPAAADAFFADDTGATGEAKDSNIKKWADFSLLPPFEAIAKYFYFTVYAGNFDANGFTFKIFAPTPPGLKK